MARTILSPCICVVNTHLQANKIENGGLIKLLNGATGTLSYLKTPYNVYLVFGYVTANSNTWYANFPVVPSSMYPQEGAKLIAVSIDDYSVVSSGINRARGMTVPKVGGYWITGIVLGES